MRTLEGFHLMVDLETLSTQPKAVVTCIGFAVFDRTGIVTSGNLFLNVDRQNDREVSMDTLRFWAQQDQELFLKQLSGDMEVSEAWGVLKHIVEHFTVSTFWGNPARFDQGILEDLFIGCQLGLFWDHRQWECFRTFMKRGPEVERQQPTIAHDAEQDAIAQALTIIRAYTPVADHLDREAEGWMTT